MSKKKILTEKLNNSGKNSRLKLKLLAKSKTLFAETSKKASAGLYDISNCMFFQSLHSGSLSATVNKLMFLDLWNQRPNKRPRWPLKVHSFGIYKHWRTRTTSHGNLWPHRFAAGKQQLKSTWRQDLILIQFKRAVIRVRPQLGIICSNVIVGLWTCFEEMNNSQNKHMEDMKKYVCRISCYNTHSSICLLAKAAMSIRVRHRGAVPPQKTKLKLTRISHWCLWLGILKQMTGSKE